MILSFEGGTRRWYHRRLSWEDLVASRTFEAVIFDMDGLLIDTEALARRTWRQAADDCGFELDDALFAKLVGRTRRDSSDILTAAFGDDFALARFRERCSVHWEIALLETGIAVKSGAIELLDLLDSAGVPRAVATSTGRAGAERSLALAGVRERFPNIVTGDQVERGKPAPDIFLLAAETIDVAPSDCLVLEDSLYGVMAAHAAGMTPIMVPDLVEPTEAVERLAYRIVPSLHAVRELLLETGALRV